MNSNFLKKDRYFDMTIDEKEVIKESNWLTGEKCSECGRAKRLKSKDYTPEIKARQREYTRAWRASKKVEKNKEKE